MIDGLRAKPRWIAGAVAVIAASLVAMVSMRSYPVILAGVDDAPPLAPGAPA